MAGGQVFFYATPTNGSLGTWRVKSALSSTALLVVLTALLAEAESHVETVLLWNPPVKLLYGCHAPVSAAALDTTALD